MTQRIDWLTNDPEVAAKLNAADRAYEAAKLAAAGLPLALRIAKAARIAAYREATAPCG